MKFRMLFQIYCIELAFAIYLLDLTFKNTIGRLKKLNNFQLLDILQLDIRDKVIIFDV